MYPKEMQKLGFLAEPSSTGIQPLMANIGVPSFVRELGLGTCHTILEPFPCLSRTVHAARATNP